MAFCGIKERWSGGDGDGDAVLPMEFVQNLKLEIGYGIVVGENGWIKGSREWRNGGCKVADYRV